MGIFSTMEQAVSAAKESQRVVKSMPLEQREKIIANIRAMTLENAETFARMAVEETGMGNVEHKILKHRLTAEKTPGTEDISARVLHGDKGQTLVKMAPFGVIGAITPSTNPSETIICNTIGMLAGGNTVVFNPHPGAVKTSLYAIDMINRASLASGGVGNIACAVESPTAHSGETLMKHKDITLLVATGGTGLVNAVLASGKRGIGAGAGNPPVLVDETANLAKAAEDIINGCTFDNNLPCISEKAIVAVASVADELIRRMANEQGCYHATDREIARLHELVFTQKGLNRDCVGKSAAVLMQMAGITPPAGVRCIIFEAEKEHPLIAEELMMPILGMVRASGFEDAVEKALWLEQGYRHSAHIHSKNIDRLEFYENMMDTAILVKNAPSYAALGFGSNGFCTFTIASRTGEGLTSAATFTKQRRSVTGGYS